MVIIKKRYIVLFIIFIILLIFFWSAGVRDEKYKFYKYDCDPAKTFEEGLQVIGLTATGDKKLYNFLVYSRLVRERVNKVYFTIQDHNSPINKNVNFEVRKIILKNNEEEILTSKYKRYFTEKWSFDYTNEIKPDFVDPDVFVYSRIHDPVNKTIMGSLNTKDETLGSYYYVFEFDKELKQTDKFQILIYYTSDYNTEEKILEVSAEFSGYLEKRTYAYDREVAKY